MVGKCLNGKKVGAAAAAADHGASLQAADQMRTLSYIGPQSHSEKQARVNNACVKRTLSLLLLPLLLLLLQTTGPAWRLLTR
jgi:hypothetical protein